MLRTACTAGLLMACFAGCISPDRHREVLTQRDKLEDQRDDLLRVNEEYQIRNQELLSENERLTPLVREAAYLRDQRKKIEDILSRLRQDGGGELPRGVDVVANPEGLALRVEGSVLFSSGSIELTAEGRQVLGQLADAVQGHAGRVRVSGHTDNDPIVHSQWETNIRLSAERAMAVREFLISQGAAAERMSIAGYGEFVPVDPGDNSRNRRVEIVLLR